LALQASVQAYHHDLSHPGERSMFRAAITLLCACAATTSSAVAQTVTYWEHLGNPNKDVRFDSQQCNDYGRAQAYRRLITFGYRAAPNTPIGQLIGGIRDAALQTIVQSEFDNAYARCMGQLGWRKVSSDEIARRELVQREARYEAEVRAQRQRANDERALRKYLTDPPRPFHEVDDFERMLRSGATLAHIPNRLNLIGFTGGFTIHMPRDQQRQKVAALNFRVVNQQPVLRTAPSLILLVNGEPLRFEGDRIKFHVAFEDGRYVEEVTVLMAPAEFFAISHHDEIRARLGTIEFTYPDGHVQMMRSLARAYAR
jgi:hypothetical protein